MSTYTKLQDVFRPDVYWSYNVSENISSTAFSTSGIAVTDSRLKAALDSTGMLLDVPMWNRINNGTRAQITNDVEADRLITSAITTNYQRGIKVFLAEGWSVADVVEEQGLDSAIRAIRSQAESYWADEFEGRLMSASMGLMLSNAARQSGDLIHDATGVGFSRTLVNLAAHKFGDRLNKVKMIAVHPDVHLSMVEADTIKSVRDSDGGLVMETYANLQVVVSDSLPVDAAGNYTTLLYSPAAFGWAQSGQEAFVEHDRYACKGGGMTTLIEKRSFLIHPFGFSCDDTGLSGNGLTVDQLKEDRWDRVVDRKSASISFLISKA